MSFCVFYFLLSAFSSCLTIRNCRYYWDGSQSGWKVAVPLDECSRIYHSGLYSRKYVCNSLNNAIISERHSGTTCSNLTSSYTVSTLNDRFDCQSTESCNTVDYNMFIADNPVCTGSVRPYYSAKVVADGECFAVNATYSIKSECTADGTVVQSFYYGVTAPICSLSTATATYIMKCFFHSDTQTYRYQSFINCDMTSNTTTTTSTTVAPNHYYNKNIYSDQNMLTSHSVNITAVDDNQDTTFYVKFEVNDYPCYDPMISFKYEQIDIASPYEYISLYDESNTLIKQCQGNGLGDIQCGVFWTCLSNYSLGVDRIDVGSNYTIRVVESANTDALCSHSWTINANLTLTCKASTTTLVSNTSNVTTTSTTATTATGTNTGYLTSEYSTTATMASNTTTMTIGKDKADDLYDRFNNDDVLLYLIIGICTLDAILFLLCLLYLILGGFRNRTNESGNTTWLKTIKVFGLMELISIALEVFDTVTDYLFSISLIVGGYDPFIKLLGWIALMVAVIGLVLFNLKYLLFKKLIAFQVIQLLKKRIKTRETETDILMIEIRKRKVDVDVFSLLIATVEDVPQAAISIIVVSLNIGWDVISIINLSSSAISFVSKCTQVAASKFGCKDPHSEYSLLKESTVIKYEQQFDEEKQTHLNQKHTNQIQLIDRI